MGLEPIKKWDHLYCAVKGCGYPVSPFPPEAMCGVCTACGSEYSFDAVVAEEVAAEARSEVELLKAPDTDLKSGFPFSLQDASVRTGVEWLQNVAAGAAAQEKKTVMDTILEYCGKCRKRTKCTYYSKQTRGADEGQTQFYTCTVCEDEWQAHS
eukprot:TRINITY_DN73315_c0_g1_i1.p1 TRINITY_DN73315_c0_g1~~TRINITY_DN73315_c0_g1_i1.p1  ORF type:complete len:154 (+),score=55.85 TRINITY_DN73315_c0_g1_i1:538-999(+)